MAVVVLAEVAEGEDEKSPGIEDRVVDAMHVEGEEGEDGGGFVREDGVAGVAGGSPWTEDEIDMREAVSCVRESRDARGEVKHSLVVHHARSSSADCTVARTR